MEKISYERCVYESVYDESIYYATKFEEKNVSGSNELTYLCPASSIEYVWPKFQF